MRKLFSTLGLLITISALGLVLFAQSAFALSVSPAKIAFDIAPGETQQVDLVVTDQNVEDLSFQVVDFYYNDSNAKEFLTDGSSLATGLKDWISVNDDTLSFDANEEKNNLVTISVPEDAVGGAYYSAILIEAVEKDEEVGKVSVKGRLAVIVTVNVKGDNVEEILELNGFTFDQNSSAKGQYQFLVNLNNSGDTYSSPIGKITIYDLNGNQIKNISKTVSDVNGQEVVTGFADEINISTSANSVYPGKEESLTVPWPSPNIADGTYKATLNLFYGIDSKELTAETEFSIEKGLSISEFKNNDFGAGKPVLFNGKIDNSGGLPISFNAEIRLTNTFGKIVEILPVTSGVTKIESNESYTFDSIEWLLPGTSGLYNATLYINQGSNNILAEKSISLYVIVWWQIIVGILVVVLIIFAIYKYIKMAKAAKELKSKEKEE